MKRLGQNLCAFVLFAALVILVFPGVITGRGIFFAGDISQHYIPWETFVDNEIEAGHFPQWDPLLFGGYPIHAEGQSGILYPVTRLVYFLFDNPFAFSLDMLLHLVLGGFFVYLFARRLNLGFYPALYSGAIFTLAGYPVSMIVNAPILRSIIWMPLIAMLVWSIWQGSGLRNAIWLALAIAIQIFAGSMQAVAITFVMIFFMSLFLFIGGITARRPVFMPIFWTLFTGVLLGLIIASVQILPTHELYQQSFINLDLRGDEADTYSFSGYHLLDLLIPPYWAQSKGILARSSIPFQMTLFLWIGTIPFMMMLIGMFNSKSGWTLKLLAICGILMGFGASTFFYPLMLKILPPLSNFRAPDRFLALYAFAAALLAGYGFKKLMGNELPPDPKIKRKWLIAWIVALVVVFAFSIITDLLIPGAMEKLYSGLHDGMVGFISSGKLANLGAIFSASLLEIFISAILIAITLLASVKLSNSRHRAAILGVIVFAISITESGIYLKLNPGTKLASPDFIKYPPAAIRTIQGFEGGNPDLFNPPGNPSDASTAPGSNPYRIDLVGYVDYSREIFGNTPLLLWYHGGGRIDDFWKFREIVNPNFANNYGFGYISGISSLYTSNWNHFMDMLEYQKGLYITNPEYFRSRIHLWDLAGVRYVLSSIRLPEGRLELLNQFDFNGVYIYWNRRALPRAFVIYPEKVLPENQQIDESMMKGELDIGKNLVLDDNIKEPVAAQLLPDISNYSLVRIDEYSNNKVRISGVSLTDGYLVLADPYYPGWECRINDKKTQIYKAYSYFRAVPLKEGRFEAVFTFRPSSFRIGMIISSIGLVLWVLLAIVSLAMKTTTGLQESPKKRQYQND